jgi:hypothetical protein
MASKKEIEKHLKMALKEIGPIKPWFDKEVKAWVFEHAYYPVSYAGDTPEEVIKKYPLHLREFIIERLKNNLDPLVENQTKGHGGARKGAGRPVGTKKEPTLQIRVPLDIAQWLKNPGVIPQVRSIISAYRHV